MDIEKLSRRSFMKKTTVLAVGVASMTLFSGLVNASDTYYVAAFRFCRGVVELMDEGLQWFHPGNFEGTDKCFNFVKCIDPDGNEFIASANAQYCPSYEEDPARWSECHDLPFWTDTIPDPCVSDLV